MFTRTLPQLSRYRFVYRDNKVPFYQKLFQTNDGKRMWWKKWLADVALSDLNLHSYCRWGHKTWFGKD
ncbi:hypothetical protein N7462_007720 [Penicillium macrosclerotiorum]|uniref:uncharacterized protein n=1 Tax=Penicillium macrosclerotiorum TaxID=303699 RepID=UPI00254994F4|nr:uncharacterized protein N7462_007720 [Penicillium macrosclerotiorum]KAJ5679476.1 hypothetical protein N7462_007720 [Penicillium macrosclerotiorum]